MKKNNIPGGKFDEILEFTMKGDNYSFEYNIRNLKEDSLIPTGIYEETVFQKTINNINLTMKFSK